MFESIHTFFLSDIYTVSRHVYVTVAVLIDNLFKHKPYEEKKFLTTCRVLI